MDQISDEEFLATPLNVLANDPQPEPPNLRHQTHPKGPGTCPTIPGRSTHNMHTVKTRADLEPERSLEFDNLRQIKHADPYGRVTLGRNYSYQTFIVEELSQGSLLLRPAVIMEKRHFDRLPRDPKQDLFLRIPTMR